MKHLKIYLFLLAPIYNNSLYAQLQGQEKIDSLAKEISVQKVDTNKANLIMQVIKNLDGTDPEQYGKYAREYLEISTKIGSTHRIGVAYNVMGSYFLRKAEYASALDNFFKALKKNEEEGSKPGIAAVLGNIGLVYHAVGDKQKALEYLSKSLASHQELENPKGIAAVTCNIGIVYKDMGENAKALEYLSKAYELDEEGGYKEYAAIASSNLGHIYRNQEDYQMALAYYQRSLQIAKTGGYKNTIAENFRCIGKVYLRMAEDSSAKERKMQVSPELPGTGYAPGIPVPRSKAALISAAIEQLQAGLILGKETGKLDLLSGIYETMSNAYKLRGDYKHAMEYGDSAKMLTDSMNSKENSKRIANLEYDRKTFADSVKAATAQKLAHVKAASRRNYELIGGAAFLSLLGVTILLKKKNTLLDKEKKRSDDLLLNILPEEVASQLKDTGKSAAKQFDNVTVLFTDFVNFTEASERMKPDMLIEELDTCFKAFDEITARYNIEKIKTIGDAYLAVCGLPSPDPQHALNIVSAAREINEFMENRLARMGNDRTFPIRIGIHSGSVVAGIVGIKKFAYDIWGDTVNTAARMEQHGESGQINISQTTYDLVKDKVRCEFRGELQVKGKGAMKMYFVS